MHLYSPRGSIKLSHQPSTCIKLFITKSNNALSADSGETVINGRVSMTHCKSLSFAIHDLRFSRRVHTNSVLLQSNLSSSQSPNSRLLYDRYHQLRTPPSLTNQTSQSTLQFSLALTWFSFVCGTGLSLLTYCKTDLNRIQRIPALKIMLVSHRRDFQCDLLCDIVTTWCNLDSL